MSKPHHNYAENYHDVSSRCWANHDAVTPDYSSRGVCMIVQVRLNIMACVSGSITGTLFAADKVDDEISMTKLGCFCTSYRQVSSFFFWHFF